MAYWAKVSEDHWEIYDACGERVSVPTSRWIGPYRYMSDIETDVKDGLEILEIMELNFGDNGTRWIRHLGA